MGAGRRPYIFNVTKMLRQFNTENRKLKTENGT
jgi:hypothetical protein